ncbi:unnamed protein product [Caenorhabditis bovis]|uniref:Ig-like domain-containing protein n=1 Tax=Caenorhabditis bovis TaxID=2654633 RepID=A0A8S1EYD1_9PELO|nr:unnamed protein product [Caenorhabditis bovis]
MMLLLILTLSKVVHNVRSFNFGAPHKIGIQMAAAVTSSSYLRWVPPNSQEWRHTNISLNVRMYWEGRWARARYAKGCSGDDDIKIIPVYFWPGERVDLNCNMCRISYLMNGLVKRWGYAEDIDEFLLNPQQFTRVNELWSEVHNVEWHDEKTSEPDGGEGDAIYLPNTNGERSNANGERVRKTHPKYWQNNGRLTMLNLDARAQGVYFCYDDESKKHTSFFYVLMAMLPPFRITTDNPNLYSDYCGEPNDDKISPAWNWRYHFLPMADFHAPPSCRFDGDGDVASCRFDDDADEAASNWPPNIVADECNRDKCRAKLISPSPNIDYYIEMRWDEWTSCDGAQTTKRREAHCYLVRGEKGAMNVANWGDAKFYKWARHLETVFDRKPFDTEGIRLYSSLLTAAIYDQTKLTNCHNADDSERYELYDQVWRNVFMRSFGLTTADGKPIESDNNDANSTIRNPLAACLRYSIHNGVENLLGTFATQVDYC